MCNLCHVEISCKGSNTSRLHRHVKTKHTEIHRGETQQAADDKANQFNSDGKRPRQESISKFTKQCPNFEDRLLTWVCDAYQPLSACTRPSFRNMIASVNPNCPIIGKDRMSTLVESRAAHLRSSLKVKLKKLSRIAVASDGWTSKGNDSFFGLTAHWIDEDWILRSCPLAITKKVGRSTAEDYMDELNRAYASFEIDPGKAEANVTDTEPTMVAFGRLVKQRAIDNDRCTTWHGCIDHIVNYMH